MASSDKPSFDVFAMLLLLGFLMTLGAALLLNDALTNDWGFKLGGDAPPAQSWHLTQYRDLAKNYNPNAPFIDVRKKDIEEWERARNKTGKENGKAFPVKDYEWPAGYKVNEFPVDPSKSNNWEDAQPNANDAPEVAKTKAAFLEQYNLLLTAAAVAPVPEAPKETPKDEAAPKKDDAAVPAEKKDETKKEVPKKDDAAAPKKDDAAAPTEKKDEVKKEEAK